MSKEARSLVGCGADGGKTAHLGIIRLLSVQSCIRTEYDSRDNQTQNGFGVFHYTYNYNYTLTDQQEPYPIAMRRTRGTVPAHAAAVTAAFTAAESLLKRAEAATVTVGRGLWAVQDDQVLSSCKACLAQLTVLIGNAQHSHEDDDQLREYVAQIRRHASFFLRADGKIDEAANSAADSALHFTQRLVYWAPRDRAINHLRQCLHKALDTWAHAELDRGDAALALHLFEQSRALAVPSMSDLNDLERLISNLRVQIGGRAPLPQPPLQPQQLPNVKGMRMFPPIFLPPRLLDNVPDLQQQLLPPAPPPAQALTPAPAPAPAPTPAPAPKRPRCEMGSASSLAPSQPAALMVAPGSLVDKKNRIAAQYGWDHSKPIPLVASEAANDLGIVSNGKKCTADLINEVHALLFG